MTSEAAVWDETGTCSTSSDRYLGRDILSRIIYALGVLSGGRECRDRFWSGPYWMHRVLQGLWDNLIMRGNGLILVFPVSPAIVRCLLVRVSEMP